MMVVASSPPSSRHHLRSSSSSASYAHQVDYEVGRHLQDDDNNPTTVFISEKCLDTLSATADENGRLGNENYYVFSDGMSNGYYSTNNMTSYSDLPIQNKFAFVTLSCQCQQFGGASNCCQGPRANINVAGINADDPTLMNEQLTEYIADICEVTLETIGEENILAESGEGPIQLTSPSDSPSMSGGPTYAPSLSVSPSSVPSMSKSPSSAPSVSSMPSETPSVTAGASGIVTSPGNGDNNKEVVSGGLSSGAIAGIAIGGVAVLGLMLYAIMSSRRKDVNNDEEEDSGALADNDDLNQSETGNANNKDLLAIGYGNDDLSSPGGGDTNSMTAASDVSSLATTKASGSSTRYYADNSLLPQIPDDDEEDGVFEEESLD